MKPLFILALMLMAAAPAPAAPAQDKYVPMSVKDWEARSDTVQILYVSSFVALIANNEAALTTSRPTRYVRGFPRERLRTMFPKASPW